MINASGKPCIRRVLMIVMILAAMNQSDMLHIFTSDTVSHSTSIVKMAQMEPGGRIGAYADSKVTNHC